jgi:hypothetical protein
MYMAGIARVKLHRKVMKYLDSLVTRATSTNITHMNQNTHPPASSHLLAKSSIMFTKI